MKHARHFGEFVVVVCLAGCLGRHSPLSETPISGAEPDIEAEIRRVLWAFEADIGAKRLGIPEIRVEPNDTLGSIKRSSMRISLDQNIDVDDVSWVLRHELCHALDFTEGLVELGDSAFLDDLADGLFESDLALEADYTSNTLRRSEAMATFCSLGPLAATALQNRCGGEAQLGATTFQWLEDRVWSAAPGATTQSVEASSYGSSSQVDVIIATPTSSPPDGLRLRLGRYDGSPVDFFEDVVVDAASGEPLDVEPRDAIEIEPSRDVGEGPDYEVLYDLTAGWPGGDAGAVATFYLYHLVQSEFRLFVRQGAGWLAVDPTCDLNSPTLFSDGSRLGLAWAAPDAVKWRWLTE